MPSKSVDLYTSSDEGALVATDLIMIKVGHEAATMTASEWAQLIARPKRIPKAHWPGGIDHLDL